MKSRFIGIIMLLASSHVACIQQEEVIVKKCFFKGMDGFPAKNYTCEKKKFKGEILLCKISYAVNGWQIIDSVSFSKEGDKNCAKSYHPIYDIQSRYIKKYELNGIDCNQVNTNLGNELPQINDQYLLSEDYLADLSFLLDKKPRENENGFQFDEEIIPSLFAQYGIPYDEQLLNFDFNVEAGLISYDSFNYLNYVLKRKFRYENNILKEVKISVERKKEGLIAEYFESFMLCK